MGQSLWGLLVIWVCLLLFWLLSIAVSSSVQGLRRQANQSYHPSRAKSVPARTNNSWIHHLNSQDSCSVVASLGLISRVCLIPWRSCVVPTQSILLRTYFHPLDFGFQHSSFFWMIFWNMSTVNGGREAVNCSLFSCSKSKNKFVGVKTFFYVAFIFVFNFNMILQRYASNVELDVLFVYLVDHTENKQGV